MNSTKKRGKRLRMAPVRKWQRYEENLLIAFLKINCKDFEKPTAQQYYSKFISETNITDIEWKLIRAKVRNMKMCYNRTKQWLESSEAKALNEDNRHATLSKMCHYYDDFGGLFGEISNTSFTFDGGSMCSDFVKDENLSDDCQTSYTTEEMCTEPLIQDEATNNGHFINEDTVNSLKAEDLKLQREKLEFEKLKLRQELDIKQREIDSQEKLKILELEMKERIAMNEIKMKERVALKALEKKWD